MGNVTGASVVEGKYVNVRGLQGRYVNVQLNGTTLPSADPDGNSVALDIFPSSLIDNIVTKKTFTPDQPGTFTGGVIDVTTKSFPSDFFFNASVSTSFNSEVGVGGNILRPTEGLSEVPSAANDPAVPQNIAQTFGNPESTQALDDLSRAFATSVSPRQDEILANRSAEASFGNQFQVFGDRSLGVIASLVYDESFSGFDDGVTTRFQQGGVSSDRLAATADYTTRGGTQQTLIGGLAGVNLQLAPKHEIGFRILANSDEEERATFQSGFLPRDLSAGQEFETRTSRVIERSIWSGELNGTHQFGEGQDGVRLQWKTTLAEVRRDEPDSRFFSNQFTPGETDTTFAISKAIYPLPARVFRELSEQNRSAEASIEIPIGAATITTGGRFL
jgi:hypothetical protein